MSQFLCLKCNRFHETKQAMKNCSHEDVVKKIEEKRVKKVAPKKTTDKTLLEE